MSAEVGGISALTALEILSADEKSQVLAFVSKPPADAVRQHIIAAMKAAGKPVVALFLGFSSPVAREENVWFASTLDEAARLACLLSRVTSQRKEMVSTGGVIRGLYTGGTLAAEAAGLLAGYLGVAADTEHHHGMMLDADGHQIIDLGDDFYTVGRPHPMIDPALRNQLIAGLGAQPQVRVLLVDVVIGFGATADPAASLIQAAEGMRRTRQRPAAVRHRNRHRNGTRSSVPLATNRRARRCRHHGSGFPSRSHSVGRGTDSTPLSSTHPSAPGYWKRWR